MRTAKLTLALLLVSLPLVAQDAPQPGQRRGPGGMGMGRGARVMGAVTAIKGTQLTIKNDEDGATWTVDTTDNTRLTKDRQPAKLTDVAVGTTVMAIGMPEGDKKELHALFVSVMTPEQAKAIADAAAQAKANLGKTYIIGHVTKIDIDALTLTIQRSDKVEQTVAVDENTLLRRGGNPNINAAIGVAGGGMGGFGGGRQGGNGRQGGGPPDGAPNDGEPITLADIKVGDNVAGPGALHANTFLLKELHVLPQRRPRPEGGAPTAPPQ